MANHTNLSSLFTDIADAIRAKTGEEVSITADEFPEAIRAIPTGGTGATVKLCKDDVTFGNTTIYVNGESIDANTLSAYGESDGYLEIPWGSTFAIEGAVDDCGGILVEDVGMFKPNIECNYEEEVTTTGAIRQLYIYNLSSSGIEANNEWIDPADFVLLVIGQDGA